MNLQHFEEAPVAILFTDLNGSVLFSNAQSLVLLKTTKEDLLVSSFHPFIRKDYVPKYLEALNEPELYPTLQLFIKNNQDTDIPVQITINPIEDGLLWYIEDRSELFNLYLEHKRLQNFPKEYGHNINNFLTVILSATQLIEMDLEESSEIHVDLKDITDAAYRAAAQTRLFMNMGRQSYIKNEYFNLNDFILEKEEFFTTLLQGKCLLHDNCWMYGSPSNIQAALSLTILHFKNRQPNCHLILETHVIDIAPPFSSHSLGLTSGTYICCTVRENDFIEDKEIRTSDRFQEHDEGSILSSMWDAIIHMRGSIIQRRTPQNTYAISIYLPLMLPEEYT